MGSLQKAVKASLAVLDDRMLDPWIPDEDWDHQIRESGKNNCFLRNLNSALAKECVWQNNHAILRGQILFYAAVPAGILPVRTCRKINQHEWVGQGNVNSERCFRTYLEGEEGMWRAEEGPGLSKRRASRRWLDSPRISIPPRLEARSETSALQTRHNGERRNDKWWIRGRYDTILQVTAVRCGQEIFEEEWRQEIVYSSSNKIVLTKTKCVPVATLATLRCNDLICQSGKGFHQLVVTTTRSEAATTTTKIMICCLSKILEFLAECSRSQKN
jgi:hypothetical protein